MAEPSAEETAIDTTLDASNSIFYCRYYVGHIGKFGHEWLEFELGDNGRTLRYSNNSSYKQATQLKKQATVAPIVRDEMARLVVESGILDVDDTNWPAPDRGGRQELEIVCSGVHMSLSTNKISMMSEIIASKDPVGLEKFFTLVQDLKSMVLTMMSMHHRVRPVDDRITMAPMSMQPTVSEVGGGSTAGLGAPSLSS